MLRKLNPDATPATSSCTLSPRPCSPGLEVREHLFAEARAAISDYDPAREFLVLVWLPASMFFYRRKLLHAGTG